MGYTTLKPSVPLQSLCSHLHEGTPAFHCFDRRQFASVMVDLPPPNIVGYYYNVHATIAPSSGRL